MPGSRHHSFEPRFGESDRGARRRSTALERHLTSPAGRALAETIGAFRMSLDALERDERGHDVFNAGAEAFVELLGEQPALGDDAPLAAALPVLGEEGPGERELRSEAAELIAIGTVAIGATKGPSPEYADALVKTALGSDRASALLRATLLGKPFPDGDFGIPPKLIDMVRDLERRTCGLGLHHAVVEWGRAASQSKSSAWSTGITALTPSVGCAGTQVTISGSGFGATQPSDTMIFFPRRGGGCTPAQTVVSWSDTQIVVVAPADVGSGCVGFVIPGDPGGLGPAASSLAGELVRCVGKAAHAAAQRFETVGSKPIMVCPPCLPGGVNFFKGGRPFIRYFGANGWTEAEVTPGGALTLTWNVTNANSVEIAEVPPPPGQADELPSVVGPLNNVAGAYTFPSVAGTFTWDRQYELRARNGCTPQASPETARVTVRMRSRPDLAVVGIEATQATQFFNAAVHMPNAAARKADNAVSLIGGKPTVVRVFVDSGQAATFEGGIVNNVRARLHGRTAAGATLPGSPLAPLNASFVPAPTAAIQARRRAPLTAQIVAQERTLPTNRAFIFRLPAAWAAAGAIDVEAELIVPAGVTDPNLANNRLTQRLVFNAGGLPIRIALLRVSYNDPTGGALVPPPTPAQAFAELDFIQRVYPSNRALLNVVAAPGGANPWFFSGDLSAGGPGCGMGWNSIQAELAVRAFFSFGFEDRVWVALLNRPPSGNSGPAGGCGMPMSSLGASVIGGITVGALLAGTAVLGPFAGLGVAAILARLGTSALGVATSLVARAGVPAGTGGILAQEIGHSFGLMHIAGAGAPGPFETGWPDYQGVGSTGANFQSIGEFGLDVDDSAGFTLRAYAPATFGTVTPTTDFMSYASATDWVSPFIYEKMMGGTITPPPGLGPAPAPPLERPDEVEPIDVALVSGTIAETGLELRPIFTQRRRFAFDEREDGRYRVELRAHDGGVLAARPIHLLDHEHDGDHGHDDGREAAELPFVFATAVPWHPRTAAVVVLRDGDELGRQLVADEAPAVTEPVVEETEDGWRVHWEGGDGGDVRYLVRYAVAERDDEPLWQFLAADLPEPEIELRRGVLQGGSARIQVGASAGGRTAWVESAPFEVSMPPPEVVVIAPAADARLRAGRPVALYGEAMSLEPEETIDDGAFLWESDRDGPIGTGRRVETAALTLGRHELTLRVEAPGRPEATAHVTVTVSQRHR